jgi:hypothetical protein
MGIAIPSVSKSFQSMDMAKRTTSRYPDAWRTLDAISDMLRRTYPTALTSGGAFVGRNISYDAGGVMIPSDELSFPVLDTGLAQVGSVQEVSYRLEQAPEGEVYPMVLVQTRASLGAEAGVGIQETLLARAIGLDFSYLDESVEPAEWVQEWPPASAGASLPPGWATEVVKAVLEGQMPASGTAPEPKLVRLPRAVKITIFMPGEITRQPTSFTTVVNVPSR